MWDARRHWFGCFCLSVEAYAHFLVDVEVSDCRNEPFGQFVVVHSLDQPVVRDSVECSFDLVGQDCGPHGLDPTGLVALSGHEHSRAGVNVSLRLSIAEKCAWDLRCSIDIRPMWFLLQQSC